MQIHKEAVMHEMIRNASKSDAVTRAIMKETIYVILQISYDEKAVNNSSRNSSSTRINTRINVQPLVAVRGSKSAFPCQFLHFWGPGGLESVRETCTLRGGLQTSVIADLIWIIRKFLLKVSVSNS